MNRPNQNNYPDCPVKSEYWLEGYYNDLEKYCDELEFNYSITKGDLLSCEEELTKRSDLYNNHIIQLYKALDEACSKLEMGHRCLYNLVTELNDCSANPRTEPYPMWKTKEEWKEYLLDYANK